LWVLFSFLYLSVSQYITVPTSSGTVRGFIGNGVRNFLGIPYAMVPMRFGLPQPRSWEGILNATQYGYVCPQVPSAYFPLQVMSEDCLFLNIWGPMEIDRLLPVMFWIHGGSFTSGAGSLYNGTNVAKKDVIIVTINYRLGPLGYFQSMDIRAENPTYPTLGGMNGLLDQLFALKWINENIAAFGGDPNDITIWGESAGGLSVCSLAASPDSAGLFKHVIIESGSCFGPWGPSTSVSGLENSASYLYYLNLTTIDDLRRVPFTTLISLPSWDHVGPSVDDKFLMATPAEIYWAGYSSIPARGSVLIGTNTLDTLFTPPFYNGPFPTDNSTLMAVLTKYFGTDAQEIFNLYPGNPTPMIAFQRINAHLCLTCPTLDLAHLLAHKHFVFEYEFGYDPLEPHWAIHFAEVPFVFGGQAPGFPYDAQLSEVMMDYWTSFARTGIPRIGASVWPPFQAANQSVYFDSDISVQQNIHQVECSFWNNYGSSPANYYKMLEYCFQIIEPMN